VLCRRDDLFAGRPHAEYLVAHIPGAKLVEVPGADNFIFAGDSETDLDEIEEFLTGARQSHATDRVLATVMFTDIVASTERAADMGDHKWRDLLDAHDRIVRRQLERFRGQEINTVGDGFLATFDGPGRAIECARAICEAVRALGIAVRAGLHTGEIEVRGADVAGWLSTSAPESLRRQAQARCSSRGRCRLLSWVPALFLPIGGNTS
jgi:hypothetical protein